ncbi:hypothetical protein FKM82_013977 [Ascaphus truei]
MCPRYIETDMGNLSPGSDSLAQNNAEHRKHTSKIKRDLVGIQSSLEPVQYFMGPLVYQGSVPLQDAEVTALCNDTNNEVTTVAPRKVSFRITTENFLLEVQVEDRQEWLPTCHERWNSTWGTLICRHLGYIRLTQHKGVNMTDIKLNHSQEFVQVPLGQTSGIEHIWQIRRGCVSGRIVAIKCSECGTRSKSARIIGGSDALLGRWPWQVSLYLNNKHVCGGSIVAHQWIITAAHCVHNYRSPQLSSWSIFAGIVSHSHTVRHATLPSTVEKIIYHEKYDDRSHDYDIALMKLEKSLNYSAHMPRSLKEAMLPLISTRKCNSSCVYDGDITPRMLCAGYLTGKVDACQGDSGGPLVCQTDYTWRLVGVVSWGMGCAEPNRPGVYTKIVAFLDWIHHIIEDD